MNQNSCFYQEGMSLGYDYPLLVWLPQSGDDAHFDSRSHHDANESEELPRGSCLLTRPIRRVAFKLLTER